MRAVAEDKSGDRIWKAGSVLKLVDHLHLVLLRWSGLGLGLLHWDREAGFVSMRSRH